MASNDQKTVLPSRQLTNTTTTITTNILASPRGEQLSSARVEATIIVSDKGNENAQIVLTQLPKAPSKSVKQISKTVSTSSVSQSTSTSGAMTGDKFLLCSPIFVLKYAQEHSCAMLTSKEMLSFSLHNQKVFFLLSNANNPEILTK